MTTAAEFRRADGATIAFEHRNPTRVDAPTVMFLHGLKSDMGGTKAEVLAMHAQAQGYGFLRFDMFGHGASSGRFEDGCISRWTDDTLAVIDALTSGPLILVGSSMGGWVMVRAALARPARLAGLLGIAVAPDFTEDLMWPNFTDAQRAALESAGFVDLPSEYDEGPYRISRRLIEDGRASLVLRGAVPITCPVRLLHGQGDTSVPWQTSLNLAHAITGGDVEICLIKDGDHRLSRPQDLARLTATVDGLAGGVL